jgi:hypothetical protein
MLVGVKFPRPMPSFLNVVYGITLIASSSTINKHLGQWLPVDVPT